MEPVRVLVVEDETIVAQDLVETLRGLGFDPVGIADAAGPAIEMAEARRPDLVLMDIMLKGGTSGIEAARAIRERRDVPVIFLTAFADKATVGQALSGEPYGYVLKPYDPRALQVAMQAALARHAAEQRVKDSERLLAAVLEGVDDGIMVFSADAQLERANDRAFAILGCGAGDFARLGGVVGLAAQPADRAALRAAWSRALDGESTALGWRYLRPGEPAARDAALVLRRISLGDETRLLLTIRDTTEEKRLRARELQSSRLESLGRLAGGIAHDFNNLLTAILGYGDLLAQDVGSEARDSLEQIKRSAERAATLTRQLLLFGRKTEIEARVLHVNHVVRDVEKLLRRLIGEHVLLELALAEAPVAVRIDQGQLEQVLLNLCLNARDAMPGGGLLRVSTAARDAVVELAVSDSGEGMDAETLLHVFEPFFTTKQAGQGTGLGLALVEDIVHGAGGEILAESAPGAGTVFRVLLPAAADAAPGDAERPATAVATGGDETVLVVEDDELARAVACETLRVYGYTVFEAANGAEALRVAATCDGPLDLVVADYVLPVMNGDELAQRLLERHPAAGVLLVSGYPEQYVAGKERPAHVRFLSKPFHPALLAQTVRNLLDERRR